MKVVMMAGGKGTRISSVASDIPKPMIPIDGVPVLEREIRSLKAQGLTDIIITVGQLGHVIQNYFEDGSKWGVHISYFVEETPLGNAGALCRLKDQLTEDFFLLNADALFDIDFGRMLAFHKEKKAAITIFTHPNSHPYDSGLIIADEQGRVLQWLTKEDQRPQYYANRVNAGIHILSPSVLDQTFTTEKIDLDRQILKPYAGTGEMYCYDSPEYVKDMGTPDRYLTVCEDVINGKVQAHNLLQKQKAVFLDRDGTINRYVGFLTTLAQMELCDQASEAIRMINKSGYLAIVATNQPVIARGDVTKEQLTEIHHKMETLLGKDGAYVDDICVCPHHPDSGFAGEVKALKIKCDCRKPKPGMLLKEAEKYNIDLEQSWMIGDSERDVSAGKAAGCRTVLIGNGEYGQTFTASSLYEAVKLIFSDEK